MGGTVTNWGEATRHVWASGGRVPWAVWSLAAGRGAGSRGVPPLQTPRRRSDNSREAGERGIGEPFHERSGVSHPRSPPSGPPGEWYWEVGSACDDRSHPTDWSV